MEQFEIIDVRHPEDELLKTWDPFIHSHHYEVHTTAYESWLLTHPRRSGEAYINQYLEVALFIEENPIPKDCSLKNRGTLAVVQATYRSREKIELRRIGKFGPTPERFPARRRRIACDSRRPLVRPLGAQAGS